ncbi:MAG: hypothetical protein CMP48_27125 [Rickettsiales bacterium]|nr:hypothetical protein [Rickettsiales bacterium]
MSKNQQPPKSALRLLQWFCKPWYVEVIEGDLYELYDRQYLDSPRRARWQFTWNVIRFFRWRYIKDIDDVQPKGPFGMFKTYFKVSFRNMARNKLQVMFNLLGLAIGIACCVLIMMHVKHQFAYDAHITNLENIYRVTNGGGGAYTPARLVKQMREDYPEVLNGTRVTTMSESVVKVGDRYVKQAGVMLADSTFFEVFPTKFLRGDAKNALNKPTNVVLTESVADKVFPNEDAMGKRITSDGVDYVVSAIVADPPRTTTIPYKVIVAIPWDFWATTGWWTGNNFFSYLQLNPTSDPAVLESKFPDFIERYIGPEILQYYTQYSSYQEYLDDGHSRMYELVPMSEIHLKHPRLSLGKASSYDNLVIFSIIAVFILIIACINYVNMSTAKSSLRAKEIGMRKVLGSIKGQITQQFMMESFLVAGLAILFGVLLSILVLPYFKAISEIDYQLSDIINGENILWFIGIWIIVGLLAGLYPAVYLSSFKPIAALKGESVQGGSRRMRSALVVLQFAISLFLMVATFIVYNQLNYMSNRKLGVDAEQVFVLGDGSKIADRYDAFKNQLKGNSNIEEVALSNTFPSAFMADWNYQTIGENSETIAPYNIFVSPEVMDVWGLKVNNGRFFNPEMATDTAAVVVNQTLVETLGWDDPIGQVLSRGKGRDFRVIGVIDNFKVRSAKSGEYPIVLRYATINEMNGPFVSIKVKGNIMASLDHIEKTWDSMMPGYPMDGGFMDDLFQRLYEEEKRFGLLFTGFSSLAIIIASMGLFSLAAFVLERRKKELALRKVLGANVSQIFISVSSYFGKLILIAAVIALPTSYFLGEKWLEDYVDRIKINPLIFILPLFAIFLIALLTITYQTYRSAISNPVNALKEE